MGMIYRLLPVLLACNETDAFCASLLNMKPPPVAGVSCLEDSVRLPKTGRGLSCPIGLRAYGALFQKRLVSPSVGPPSFTIPGAIGRTKTRVDSP